MSIASFFNSPATTEIYTLSLHDALPISSMAPLGPYTPALQTSTSSRPKRWSMREMSRATSRSEEHTSELQSHSDLVCRLLLEKKNKCTFQLYCKSQPSTERS